MEMRGLQIKKRKNTQKAKRKERKWNFLSANWVSEADICIKRGTTHQGGFWRGRKDFFIDFLRRRKMDVQYIPLSFPIKKNGHSLVFFLEDFGEER